MPKTPKRISIGGAPLTLEQAKQLQHDQRLYNRSLMNSRGEAQRARVTSVKTWKTRPENVVVRIRFAMESSVTELGPEHLHFWSTEELPADTQTLVQA